MSKRNTRRSAAAAAPTTTDNITTDTTTPIPNNSSAPEDAPSTNPETPITTAPTTKRKESNRPPTQAQIKRQKALETAAAEKERAEKERAEKQKAEQDKDEQIAKLLADVDRLKALAFERASNPPPAQSATPQLTEHSSTPEIQRQVLLPHPNTLPSPQPTHSTGFLGLLNTPSNILPLPAPTHPSGSNPTPSTLPFATSHGPSFNFTGSVGPSSSPPPPPRAAVRDGLRRGADLPSDEEDAPYSADDGDVGGNGVYPRHSDPHHPYTGYSDDSFHFTHSETANDDAHSFGDLENSLFASFTDSPLIGPVRRTNDSSLSVQQTPGTRYPPLPHASRSDPVVSQPTPPPASNAAPPVPATAKPKRNRKPRKQGEILTLAQKEVLTSDDFKSHIWRLLLYSRPFASKTYPDGVIEILRPQWLETATTLSKVAPWDSGVNDMVCQSTSCIKTRWNGIIKQFVRTNYDLRAHERHYYLEWDRFASECTEASTKQDIQVAMFLAPQIVGLFHAIAFGTERAMGPKISLRNIYNQTNGVLICSMASALKVGLEMADKNTSASFDTANQRLYYNQFMDHWDKRVAAHIDKGIIESFNTALLALQVAKKGSGAAAYLKEVAAVSANFPASTPESLSEVELASLRGTLSSLNARAVASVRAPVQGAVAQGAVAQAQTDVQK